MAIAAFLYPHARLVRGLSPNKRSRQGDSAALQFNPNASLRNSIHRHSHEPRQATGLLCLPPLNTYIEEIAPVPSPTQFLTLTAAIGLTLTLTGASLAVHAQSTDASGYNLPPTYILDVLRAPSPPTPIISPTHDNMLLVAMEDYPSIARVSLPFLRLAGVRVEARNHSKHDTPGGYGITACARTFSLVHVPDGQETPIVLPAGACPSRPDWAADGKHFVFSNTTKDSVDLWIGDARTAQIRQVPNVQLNPMFSGEIQWMPDQKTLLVKLVPPGIGAPPPEPIVPPGPSIQETGGQKGQSSTYENRDTLTSAHDEDLFDYYASTQIALVDIASLTVTPLGKPASYESLDAAPDGKHILVTTIHKPYSYVTTYDHFPKEVEVWDISNPAQPAAHTIASLPLADRVPIRGVPLGPREFSWRPTEPATLTWAEALDGGDWNVNVPNRDKIMWQKAPFTTPAAELTRTEWRYEVLYWGEKSMALVQEYDNNRHLAREWVIHPDDPSQRPRKLFDISTDDSYGNPGFPVERTLANGSSVLRQDGNAIYFSGTGSSPDGDRPFLDKLDLTTFKTERLFRSDKTAYERFFAFAGPDSKTFLTWHQTPTDPPNAFLRTLGKPLTAPAGEAVVASTEVAVTHIPDPTPAVRAIHQRLVKYKRADGLDLSFTLMTPPGYKEGTRVPAILYAYPEDFADASKAGQVTGSQQMFTRLRAYRYLLLAGYAIIDNASFPIVGDPKKAYDTYLDQLVADAKAAVDEAVRIGVADPDRIGVTGHSHGALMTANLIAHSDLFRAGVATSGSYNKTLTPFGFQNEQRSVWQAPDVYRQVSPFFFADTIKTPLLLIHGAEDANPGTTPIQSQKFFEAIRGNGGTTRLVFLPHEPHWYTALESNEQEIYEMLRWFDKYVKDAPPRAAKSAGN
jgi:dipeptidyl aminopeptidase/acylaminoacyl peptidase